MMEKKKNPAGSSFWQIIFPAVVAGILMILIGVWLVLSLSGGDLSRFAEISTVLLVIPVYLIALVFGLLLVGLIYLVAQIMGWIPGLTRQVLRALEKIREGAEIGTRTAAGLLIEPLSYLAGLRKKPSPADEEIKLNET